MIVSRTQYKKINYIKKILLTHKQKESNLLDEEPRKESGRG